MVGWVSTRAMKNGTSPQFGKQPRGQGFTILVAPDDAPAIERDILPRIPPQQLASLVRQGTALCGQSAFGLLSGRSGLRWCLPQGSFHVGTVR